jgi:hypothetical protein
MKKDNKKVIDSVEVEISIKNNPELGQDFVRDILQPLKDKGEIDFEMRQWRKCDFCGRKIKEEEKFYPQGDGNDKCEECNKKVKE